MASIAPQANDIDKLQIKNDRLIEQVKEAASKLTDEERLKFAVSLSLSDLNESYEEPIQFTHLKPLISAVDSHLRQLEALSSNPGSIENYLWICDTAVGWEHRLADLFNISKTTALVAAPSNLLPRLDPSTALTEQEIDSRVKSLARVVYSYRVRKGNVYSDDQELDWHRAEVFLANDILDGTIDMARRVSSISYWRLEKIWMDEVLELAAYLDWEADGAITLDPKTESYYLNAWKNFRQRIMSPSLKASTTEFGEVKRYLEEHYISAVSATKYVLDYGKNPANDIVRIKSNKVYYEVATWDTDRHWNNEKCWLDAERYTKLYYENIIPAVIEADETAADAVFQAFDYSLKGAHRIINTFEMAIAIYFLPIKALARLRFPP